LIQNFRVKAWVKGCKERLEGEGEIEASVAVATSNPIATAAEAVSTATAALKSRQMDEDGTTAIDVVHAARESHAEIISRIQEEATTAAQEAYEASGEADVPPTRAEIVGIATAAAVAASAETGDIENVPAPLRPLDPEQRAAALSDGRVLVAAGAGSGKSFTLVQRVKYLVQDRKVPPGRILVSSFNKKAALELEHKIGKAAGQEAVTAMTVGTLHGTFRRAIIKYGNPEEKAMFEQGFVGTGSKVATAVNRVWKKCYGHMGADGEWVDAETPHTKAMMMAKTKWAGNDISPAQALAMTAGTEEEAAARWYEMYLGFKGDIGPNWKPQNCDNIEAEREWDKFNERVRVRDIDGRRVKIRLGDFDDMISVFRDILARRPEVRKRAQDVFDHILIDECQDLNEIQHQVMAYLTEHITDGKDGKSYWMIGDDKQSIYSFRGARPDLFTGLDGKEGWKTRVIRTNYRCPPEVVELANKLIAHNDDQIEMDANPSPGRARGQASITVSNPDDEAQAAMQVAREIKDARDNEDANVADHAILCRTNKELNSYETALLLKGIPYARKGSSSFLGSPETQSFLGYISLVTDADHEKMQKSLVEVLNRPNRFFVSPDKVERAVDYALGNYARRRGEAKKTVNPMVALRDPQFQEDLIFVLKGVRDGFKAKKGYEQIDNLLNALNELEAMANAPQEPDPETGELKGPTTMDLFDAVLDMPGIKFDVDPTSGRIRGEREVTFREELSDTVREFGGEDDVKEEDDDKNMSLGNVSFLFELAKTDPTDPGDRELPPSTPKGFWAKMQRLQEKAKELRYDIDAWEKSQADLPPDEQKPPPGVYLGTAHCSPPDEPVLTTEGWVEIGDLDPEKHRLASYQRGSNQLVWGQHGKGYPFVKAENPFKGDIFTITTSSSRTRVTPNHRMLARFSDAYFNKFAVYLMRRGSWWRIGMTSTGYKPYRSGTDLGQRLTAEKGDGLWVLEICSTRQEALLAEAHYQGYYGIPGSTFEVTSNSRTSTNDQLHTLHEGFKSEVLPRVEKLLRDKGYDAQHPLYTNGRAPSTLDVEGETHLRVNKRSTFVIRACNLLEGYMEVPLTSPEFVRREGDRLSYMKPLWSPFSIERAPYEGPVFSLTVVPYRHYVSGGLVVLNSTKGAQWPKVFVQMPRKRFPMEPRLPEGRKPTEAELAQAEADYKAERRLAYVALTRPSANLRVVCPQRYGGKPAGVSPFVHEAGLGLGENVKTPEEAIPPTEAPEEIKVAAAPSFVEDRWIDWKAKDLF
jgi:superfamily I DNA/RNA helicase